MFEKNRNNHMDIIGITSDIHRMQLENAFRLGYLELLNYIRKHSVGDYLVHIYSDSEEVFVASAGFSGGYIVRNQHKYYFCKYLSDVDKYEPYSKFTDLWIYGSLGIIPDGLVSPNENVRNFDSLDLAIIHDGNLKVSSLMADLYKPSVERNYSSDILQPLIESIEEHNRLGDLSIMLSGGVDSTLLGIAVSECGFRSKFINTSRSASIDNNSLKAQAIADKFGWNLDILGDSDFFDYSSQAYFANVMTHGLINPMNPHWDVGGSEIILSGQNADSIIGIDITKAGYFNYFMKRPKMLMRNTSLGLIAMDNSLFQILYNKVLTSYLQFKEANIGDTYLAFKSNHKVLHNKFSKSFNYKEALEYRTGYLETNRAKIEMTSHYVYRAWALRLLSSFNNMFGSKTMLPFQSSPYIAFYANQHRGLKELINPKWRESNLISSYMGEDYYSFMKSLRNIESSSNYALKKFKLDGITQHIKEPNFANNLFEKYNIEDEELIAYITDLISKLLKKDKDSSLNRGDLGMAFRLTNLSLLGKASQ